MASPSQQPFTYGLVDETDRRRERGLGPRWLPISIGLLLLLALVVVTVINFLVSGIPSFSSDSSVWASDVPFPMMFVPSWLVIVMCSMPLLAALLMWRSVDQRHGPMLSNAILYSLVFFTLMPIAFAVTYAEPSPFIIGQRTLGWHWIGTLVAVFAGIMLIIRRVTLKPAPATEPDEYEREEAWLRNRAESDDRARARLEVDLAHLDMRRAALVAEQEEVSELFAKSKNDRKLAKRVGDDYVQMLERQAAAKQARDSEARRLQELDE